MTIPMYSKKNKIFIYSMLAFGPGFELFVLLMTMGVWGLMEPSIPLMCFFSVFLVLTVIVIVKELKEKTLNSVITIDEKGVELTSKTKNFAIRWERINLIGRSRNLIIFSNKFDKGLLKHVNYGLLSNDLIYVQLCQRVIDEVPKYWDGQIYY